MKRLVSPSTTPGADFTHTLKFDRVPAQTFQSVGKVSAAIIGQLRALSAERVRKSKEFAKVTERIKRYKEQKKRKSISLNEKEFLAERAKLKTDDIFRPKDEPKGEKIKRDYYMNEALGITVDYSRLLGHKMTRK